jgi:hypothetical protein
MRGQETQAEIPQRLKVPVIFLDLRRSESRALSKLKPGAFHDLIKI